MITSATSRLLLHKNIHDKVVAKILERAGRVSVGDPLRDDKDNDEKEGEGATCMGPLVSGPQRDKVLGFISRVSIEARFYVTGIGKAERQYQGKSRGVRCEKRREREG